MQCAFMPRTNWHKVISKSTEKLSCLVLRPGVITLHKLPRWSTEQLLVVNLEMTSFFLSVFRLPVNFECATHYLMLFMTEHVEGICTDQSFLGGFCEIAIEKVLQNLHARFWWWIPQIVMYYLLPDLRKGNTKAQYKYFSLKHWLPMHKIGIIKIIFQLSATPHLNTGAVEV